jgi:hypothetical protein
MRGVAGTYYLTGVQPPKKGVALVAAFPHGLAHEWHSSVKLAFVWSGYVLVRADFHCASKWIGRDGEAGGNGGVTWFVAEVFIPPPRFVQAFFTLCNPVLLPVVLHVSGFDLGV